MDPMLTRWIEPQFLLNHLVQSTLFAGAAALLALSLQRQRAQVRYWIWFAASAKFLVPFSAFIAIGRILPWRAPIALPPLRVDAILSNITPGSADLALLPQLPLTATDMSAVNLTAVAVAIWFAGCAVMVIRWFNAMRHVSRVTQRAWPLTHGRTVGLLRALERRAGAKRALAVISAPSPFEPAIVGVVRPRLFWPVGMDDRLTDEEIEAVLTHELSHVRRRDNLTAVVHMTVEALCWFHPLVLWIGARLVHERERACDEDVLRAGRAPEVYAASILRTCEVCLAAPLPCATGITGSDLKKRIEVIMRNHQTAPLSFAARAALFVLLGAAVAVPIGIGVMMPQRLFAQAPAATPAGPLPSFEVASVKANKTGDNRVMLGMQPGGRYVASNVTPYLLIRNSYQMQDFQIVGAPDWTRSERFDINAKGDVPDQNVFFDPRSGPSRTQLMVRSLLADRFKMRSHMEKRDLPIYNLVLARSDGKLGPKLKVSTSDCGNLGRAGGPPPAPPAPGERMRCGMQMGPGLVSGGGVPIGQLLTLLAMNAQRTVIDKTGLTDRYDIDLSWTPEQLPPGARDPNGPPLDLAGTSLFTALQEQLGLKLEAARGPVDVIVIDGIEHPTED